MTENVDTSRLDRLLTTHFAGKVVRKDLTKLIKEGANVPVYVLEYLLGMYCASNDEATIQKGLQMVKRVLAENYVRADEAEKVKSKVRESGTYKVIDKITVKLMDIDQKTGKYKLSHRVLIPKPEGYVERERRPRPERRQRPERGERQNNREQRRFEHRSNNNDFHDPLAPREPKDFNDSLDHNND